MEMWAGSIVHETIAEALNRYAHKGRAIRTGELQARARYKLRTGWVESVNREWEKSPKRNNLIELYYGNGKTLPKERTDGIRDLVYGCLEAFAESTILGEILAVPYMNWKPVDQLDSFQIDGTKVWCAIDFAYTAPDGVLHVIDWKTGKSESESLRQQLACYAFFAKTRWAATMPTMSLAGVFLRDDARRSHYDITDQDLVDVQESILSSAAAMRAKLVDVENNVPMDEDAFRLCENERICSRCNFKEVCPAVAEIA